MEFKFNEDKTNVKTRWVVIFCILYSCILCILCILVFLYFVRCQGILLCTASSSGQISFNFLPYPPVFNSVSNGVYRAECFLGLRGSSTAWTKTYLTLPYLDLPYIIEEDFNPTLVLVPFIYFLAEEGSCTAIKAQEITRILIYLISSIPFVLS